MSILRMFDGKTDPEEHVLHYIQKMSLETDDEQLMCQFFPLHLTGLALN